MEIIASPVLKLPLFYAIFESYTGLGQVWKGDSRNPVGSEKIARENTPLGSLQHMGMAALAVSISTQGLPTNCLLLQLSSGNGRHVMWINCSSQ